MKNFDTNPEKSEDYKGFYHVPGYETIVISPEGRVKDLLTGNTLPVYVPIKTAKVDSYWWMNEYPSVDIPELGRRSLHRLLSYTFIPCKGDPTKLVVNHIDGDKQNYQLDNLEWATYSENIIHAYENNLRSDNRPVLVKNLITGEIKEFYSLQKAARFFNVNGSVVYRNLVNRSDNYPFRLKWDVIYKGEEWRDLTKDDVGNIRNGLPKPVVTVCMEKGIVTIYESSAHLASEFGVTGGTIYHWIVQKKSARKYNLEVYFLHEYSNKITEDTIYLEYDKSHYKVVDKSKLRRKPVPIRVTNLKTGNIDEWKSTEEFANSVGAKKNTIQKSVHRLNGKWKWYFIEYASSNKKGCPTTSK